MKRQSQKCPPLTRQINVISLQMNSDNFDFNTKHRLIKEMVERQGRCVFLQSKIGGHLGVVHRLYNSPSRPIILWISILLVHGDPLNNLPNASPLQ